MLDKYQLNYAQPSDSAPRNVTIHEHKAPTDDSARLLNELRAIAKSEVLATIPIVDNSLNATLYVHDEAVSLQKRIGVKFSLNGKVFFFQKAICALPENDEEKITETIVTALSEVIAAEILRKSFTPEKFRELMKQL